MLMLSPDQRELVVLEQEEHEPVRQDHAGGGPRSERVQRRRLDLLPVAHLSVGHAREKTAGQGKCGADENAVAGAHQFPSAAESPFASCVDSRIPTVRFDSVKVAFATRRRSALVTRSILSTRRNSSRQSP